MSELIPFKFDNREVRVVTSDSGLPWFVAADVSESLDYRMASDMTRNLDDDEKGTQIVRTLGGDQEITVINESGLYSAILKSRKPEAQRFRRWVTNEVLPSIRRTGAYAAPGPQRSSALEPTKEFKALLGVAKLIGLDKNAAVISANQAVTKLTGTNLLGLLGQTHLEQKEQIQYFTPTELGARIKLSGQKINAMLAGAGLQMKTGKVWELMEAGREFAAIYDTGKKHSDGVPVQQVKWSASVLDRLSPSAA